MTRLYAAALAALLLVTAGERVAAQDVTLTSRDGAISLSGDLLGYDGEFYRIGTDYGELTVDGSGVTCAGPGCPDLETYVARVTFSGAPVMGRVLLPALIEAFAIREGLNLQREIRPDEWVRYALSRATDGRVLGEFTFRLTSTDEGFADLLAAEADVVMALREIRPRERKRAREAGLGDLAAPGRARVLALDALLPVVAPANTVRSIGLRELARVIAGETDNWQALGGPDAPIAVHLMGRRSGVGQVTAARLLAPEGRHPSADAVRHDTLKKLLAAVTDDPFALGITMRSETGTASPLALRGSCGFALRATRRAIKSEDYPVTAPLFLYLPARRLPKLGRAFIAYLDDPSAQMVIRRAGLVDRTPEEIGLDAQGHRLANAIARAGDEVSLQELQRMVARLMPLKRLTTTFRFEVGSTKLDAQSRANVRQLAQEIEMRLYDARQLVLVGFSDGQGGAEANRRIAARRAQTVRDAVLAAAVTADPARIALETDAFGEAMPMACDDSAWGRQVNRRVEVWLR